MPRQWNGTSAKLDWWVRELHCEVYLWLSGVTIPIKWVFIVGVLTMRFSSAVRVLFLLCRAGAKVHLIVWCPIPCTHSSQTYSGLVKNCETTNAIQLRGYSWRNSLYLHCIFGSRERNLPCVRETHLVHLVSEELVQWVNCFSDRNVFVFPLVSIKKTTSYHFSLFLLWAPL